MSGEGEIDGRAVAATAASPCQSCGACCACEPDWPRFSLETEAELALIPAALVAADQSGMRWTGTRCAALAGEVGKATACTIYAVRPQVCRDCMPGDDACAMARARHGLPVLATDDVGVELRKR